MATINVLDAASNVVALEKPLAPGRAAAAASRPVALSTEDAALLTGGSVAHDAVATGVNPKLIGGYASAAAPTAVSADGDSVRAWLLRNGAMATVLTAAGALVGGDASNGLDVDVTRLPTNADGAFTNWGAGEYETVAASQTTQALGATGATGDWLEGLLVTPATTSPGVVTLLDNATTIFSFVGGASSVSNLIPFYIPVRLKSVSGAWKITTGANIQVVASGNFT